MDELRRTEAPEGAQLRALLAAAHADADRRAQDLAHSHREVS